MKKTIIVVFMALFAIMLSNIEARTPTPRDTVNQGDATKKKFSKTKSKTQKRKPLARKKGLYPYTKAEIDSEIESIMARTHDKKFDGDDVLSVNTLNVYRFLCGVPYNVGLNVERTKQAQKVADAMKETDHFDHDVCEFGDLCSLLHHSHISQKAFQVQEYIDDYGDINRERRGHRANALHPKLDLTGFGLAAPYAAMRVFGTGHGSNVNQRDWYSYPGAGYYPAKYMHGTGWTFYAPSDGVVKDQTVKVEMWEIKKAPKKAYHERDKIKDGEPVEITYTNVSGNAVNFEPAINTTTFEGIYWIRVTIGRQVFQYLVEFY